jgi:RNA polymerase sigma-70 factor (ECF subfamily)
VGQPDDQPILTRVAEGDAQAMRACIDRYGPLVWKLAWRMLPARNEAEDAVQEVFISLWENAERYTAEFGEETTFVAMIARRRLIDRGRRMRHQRQLRERTAERASTSAELPGVRSVIGGGAGDPTLAVSEAEEVQRVQAAMTELPERQREVLELALATGASHSELAGQLDMPLGTVKTLIRRGMLRLRELVEQASDSSSTPAVERSA